MQFHNLIMLIEHLWEVIINHQPKRIILLLLIILLHHNVVKTIRNILLSGLQYGMSILVPNFISQLMDEFKFLFLDHFNDSLLEIVCELPNGLFMVLPF
jgi:hypothetical protein